MGSELALSDLAEWHVVAHDREFLAVLLDRRQHVVRVGRLGGVFELDVRELLPPDDLLLLLDRNIVPGFEVTTRKMAARVSLETTCCAITDGTSRSFGCELAARF